MQEYIKHPNTKYILGAAIMLIVLLTFFNILPFYVGLPLALLGGLVLAKLLGFTVDVVSEPDKDNDGN